MDFSFLIHDLISAAVIGMLGALLKWLRKSFAVRGRHMSVDSKMSKKTLHRYFLCCLFGLLLSTVIFCSVNSASPFSLLSCVKIVSGLGIFFCVIFTWGAFDAAFAFYPSDKDGSDHLAKRPSNGDPDNMRKDDV